MTGNVPIVSFVGRSGSGKTTLLVQVVQELKVRGYRVAVVKHHYHGGVLFDVPGKDSYRYAEAGADHVVLVSPEVIVHRRRIDCDLSVDEVASALQDVDLIVVEGYKQARAPKIEVNRRENSKGLVFGAEDLLAVVSDQQFGLPVPQFELDDVQGVVCLLEERFLR